MRHHRIWVAASPDVVLQLTAPLIWPRMELLHKAAHHHPRVFKGIH
jgi:hypothetical protein